LKKAAQKLFETGPAAVAPEGVNAALFARESYV
jgi:hypothetical protein